MSFLNFAYPVQAALPVVRTYASSAMGAARPLFGIGILVTFFMVFKPLVLGLLQALKLAVLPRATREQRTGRSRMRDAVMLNRMARDLDQSQPGLAAELRGFASR